MRIAILTNFLKAQPEYALYNVAIAQADALAHHGNDVVLFVREGYVQGQPLPQRFKATIEPIIPQSTLIDYRDENISENHQEYVNKLSGLFAAELPKFDAVLTHDFVFTGWNLPYFLALEKTRYETKKQRFLHWIHSVPGFNRSWWYLRRLGEDNHRLVYPNRTDSLRVANFYNTTRDKVLYIPHIVDLRHLFTFDEAVLDFLDDFPQLMTSSVVQIYPASSDRLQAKGIRELILIFARIKERGYDVFLMIANQHADRPDVQEKIDHYIRLGTRNGLKYREDFVFTSEENGAFRGGVPKSTLMQLNMFANLFIYPTREESFGLVGPEVSLCSGALPILNKSLPVLSEVAGMNGIAADFGSYRVEWRPKDEAGYFNALAGQICSQIYAEEGIKTRLWYKRMLNRDVVYDRYYVPILEGSALWS